MLTKIKNWINEMMLHFTSGLARGLQIGGGNIGSIKKDVKNEIKNVQMIEKMKEKKEDGR